MTRPLGKPLNVETVDSIINSTEKKTLPEENTRYKIWKVIKTSKNGITAKEIEQKLNNPVSHRTLTRLLEELSNGKKVTRLKCRCDCSFLYYP